MKTVALFGGSFNPPHPGHFEMAKYIYETLGVDEIWFLFSLNWQKNSTNYESTHHRIKMGNILSKHFPDMPFVMSDAQDQLDTHKTYDVLEALKTRYTNTKFIWVMGADNLESFHSWEKFENIIENFPLAIVDRPPYTKRAKKSFTALTYAHLQTPKATDLRTTQAGWHFLENPQIDMSSSTLLAQLQNGENHSDSRFQGVADYIKKNKLYGLNTEHIFKRRQTYTYTNN